MGDSGWRKRSDSGIDFVLIINVRPFELQIFCGSKIFDPFHGLCDYNPSLLHRMQDSHLAPVDEPFHESEGRAAMMQEEKDNLIALFSGEGRWCREVEAQDEKGEAVRFDDESAVAWDLVGGMCYLFGWKRASKLFGPLSRYVAGTRPALTYENNDIHAMTALVNFNDDQDTTYEMIVSKLQELPVWHGRPSKA
jgi:hypothetical protein